MCTASTIQRRAEPSRAGTALRRFWRIVGGAKAAPLALPTDLANLTPHMRRDIGLETRAAMHWSDATAQTDRDSRRP